MEFRVSGDWHARQTRRYSTFNGARQMYARTDKTELNLLPDTTLLNRITSLDNPLQKNLGDTHNMDRILGSKPSNTFGDRYVNTERFLDVNMTKSTTNRPQIYTQQAPQSSGRRTEFFPAFFGVISDIFHNIAGVMFHQSSPRTPDTAPEPTRAISKPLDIFHDPEQIFYDCEQKDSGFEELEIDDANASPPIDEVDAIRNFSRRDCSKNNTEANQNKTHTVRAQCDARGGGGGGADIRLRGTAATMEPPEDLADQCRDKMAKIQQLLAGAPSERPKSPTKKSGFAFSRYRPKKVFVEPKAVTVDTYSEAFEAEQGRIESVDTTDFVNPGLIITSDLVHVETLPRVKLEPEMKREARIEPPRPADIIESMEIVKAIPAVPEVNDKSSGERESAVPMTESSSDAQNKHETKVIDKKTRDLRAATTCAATPTEFAGANETKSEVISSCEDKLNRLKALLSDRKKSRARKTEEEPTHIYIPPNSIQAPSKSKEEPKTIDIPPNSIQASSKTQTSDQKTVAEPQKPPQPPISVDATQKAIETQHKSIPIEQTQIACEIPQSGLVQKADTRRSPDKAIPVPKRRPSSKHHKNPNRLEAHRQRRKQLRRNIAEDAYFAREIDPGQLSSSCEDGSPKIVVTPPKIEKNCFDEIRGRFHSNSTGDEPFVIVFSDSPAASPPNSPRNRIPSDTGSEDSFIICFEDEDGGNGACFTNEVFDSDSGSDSDSDCEVGSFDSNLASCANFSRTVGDLTDESLYADGPEVSDDSDDEEVIERSPEHSTGLLLTAEKKLARKGLPEKKVRFSDGPPEVRTMCVWLYAARQARIGNWKQQAADADRFKRRIADVDMAISWVLKPQHRNRVKFQRFMPWWNKMRRLEEAERKEALRLEEERLRLEAELKLREDELKLAEEERMLEELERKRKCRRKRVTTQQFASNLAGFMSSMKKQTEAKTEQVLVNGVTEIENHGVSDIENHCVSEKENHCVSEIENHCVSEKENHCVSEIENHT